MTLFLALTLALQATNTRPVEELRDEAKRLSSYVQTDLAHQFLSKVTELPDVGQRILYRDKAKTKWLTPDAFSKLSDAEKAQLNAVNLGDAFYYETKYGTPLAYCRPLDILGQNGIGSFKNKHILDFGYGTIGHLKLFAAMGADAVGVDVDPVLLALYSQRGDQGRFGSGKVRLTQGQWPSTDEIRKAVGGRYDLIVSKNTLKSGYIHPAQPVDPRMLVHLGVDDETFVKALASSLKRGGRVLIYNLCPAQNPDPKKYIPWADGKNPFPRELWEKCGFEIVAYDVVDDERIRAMAHVLEWEKQGFGADSDTYAWYSLMVKK